MKRWFLMLLGRWRMWWGCCPLCNSDAPELYSCPVCDWWEGNRQPAVYEPIGTRSVWCKPGQHYDYRERRIRGVLPEFWWDRFLQQICPHEWTGKQLGGPPDMAESYEWVGYCKHCGLEGPED